jgi:hypothetical protein
MLAKPISPCLLACDLRFGFGAGGASRRAGGAAECPYRHDDVARHSSSKGKIIDRGES